MQKTMQQDQLEAGDVDQEQQPDLQKVEFLNQASRQQVFRFVMAQLLATLVVAAILLMFDRVVAYSSLVGGLIATLANAWLAIKVFRVKSTVAAESLLTTFYVGEIYKFVFTGAMFIVAFVLIKPVSAIALLLTYFLIHMTPAVVNVFSSRTFGDVREKES